MKIDSKISSWRINKQLSVKELGNSSRQKKKSEQTSKENVETSVAIAPKTDPSIQSVRNLEEDCDGEKVIQKSYSYMSQQESKSGHRNPKHLSRKKATVVLKNCYPVREPVSIFNVCLDTTNFTPFSLING